MPVQTQAPSIESGASPASPRRAPLTAALVALALLAALLLGNLPFLYGYSLRAPGQLFWGVPPVNYQDASQYLAFTRMVNEGSWLVNDPFTSEPTVPRLFMPQILFQALLCKLFGWGPLEAFQASRVLSGAVLLAAGWWFGTLFLPRGRQRWFYLGFLCFSAGLGYFADRMGIKDHADFGQPEGNTFFMLGNLPHLALSAGLLTAIYGALPAYERDRRPRWLWLAAGSSCLLSWTHPFDFLALILGTGVYGLIRWIAERRFPVANALHALAWGAGALPAGLYLTWITRTDPVYHALANDILKVQSFQFYAIAHAPLALPALALLFSRELRRRFGLPLCWVICAFLFLLTPWRLGGKQPRVLGGIHVPLAVLATAGLEAVGRRAGRLLGDPDRGESTGPLGATVAVGLSGCWLLLAGTGAWGVFERHMDTYSRKLPYYYLAPETQRVYQHLDREGDRSQVTLGGYFTGSWAPILADTRVFYGHWHMTLNEPVKHREMRWFFLGNATPEEKAAFLKTRGITWVVWYPWEWNYNAVSIEGIPGLSRVYTTPEMWLYRFAP